MADTLSGPVRVSLHAPALLQAGVGSLLTPHPHRVILLPDPPDRSPHVDVFDPVDNADTARCAHAPLVALLHQPDQAARARARELGAVRVLSLDVSAAELLSTLEDVRAEADGRGSDARSTLAPDSPLSVRESEVLAGVCRGLTNPEIAAELFLSINSVKTYIRTAYRKMGVARRSQAVIWGIEHGFVSH
jgi:NarL family two-component system response regulator LiaR